MKLTRAQKMMVMDGFPRELLRTEEERRAFWEANPPKAAAFVETKIKTDVPKEVLEALAEERKKSTARLRNGRVLAREKRDMVPGARWNPVRSRWEHPQQIATERQMAEEEKTVAELTARYNELASKRNPDAVPVKKFKDRATALARIAKIEAEPVPEAAAKAPRTKKAAAAKPKKAERKRLSFDHPHGDAVEMFDFTPGNDRERLLHKLLTKFGEYVSAKDLDGLESKMGGIKWRIDQKSLPFEIRLAREGGEKSYGLFRR